MNHTIINEKLKAYYKTMTSESVLQEFEDLGVVFEDRMFKKSDNVVINCRGVNCIGTVVGRKRREDVVFYDVVVDSFKFYEGITTNQTFPVHINEQLSHKLQNNILKPLDNATQSN